MSQRPVFPRARLFDLLLLLPLVLGLAGCGGDAAEEPLRLTGPSSAQEGDTVQVAVEMASTVPAKASSVQFQLHYTNAHLEYLAREMGSSVSEEIRVQHYPSRASFDIGLPLAGEGSSDPTVLARFDFLVQETAPQGVPSRLRLADLELFRDDGEMRRTRRGDGHEVAIRSTGASEETEAALEVRDQYTIMDTIRIREVEAPEPARVAIRGTYPDGRTGVVGETQVSPGHHEMVKLGLDPEFGLEDRQFAFLEAGLYRVPEETDDGSETTYHRFEAGGQRVQSSFTAHYRSSTPESEIIVEDKPLRGRTLVVDSVTATEPADLVIHRNEEDHPLIPGIIGKTRVGTGTNENVEIEIHQDETVLCGETLWPMLHVRSESADQPYEIDYPIVTEPVVVECG